MIYFFIGVETMFSRENNDSHKEERYQFMREQVKPQRKKQCLIWAKRLGILIVSACIFGGIAGGHQKNFRHLF